MKIKLKKEGGFMGLSSNADVELDKLSAEEQNLVSELIANPPKAQLDSNNAVQDRGLSSYTRDGFSYELKFKKGAKSVILKFDDKSIPEKLYSIFQKYVSDAPPSI